MSKKINLKIITHENEVFNEDVDAIYSKGVDGEFGILPDHIPFMSALDIGVTRVEKDGKIKDGSVELFDQKGHQLVGDSYMNHGGSVAEARAAIEKAGLPFRI